MANPTPSDARSDPERSDQWSVPTRLVSPSNRSADGGFLGRLSYEMPRTPRTPLMPLYAKNPGAPTQLPAKVGMFCPHDLR